MDADTQIVTSFNDYPELHVVFDFFADNPQKVMPSPATADHSRSVEDGNHGGGGGGVPRQDPYWESIRIMQTSDLFMEGMLLRSVDCKRKHTLKHLCTISCLRTDIRLRDALCFRVVGRSVRPSVRCLSVITYYT